MVIQRLQSLLLLIAAVMMGLFTFCSLGQVQTPDLTYNFTSLGFYQEGIPTDGSTLHNFPSWYFFAVSLTTVVLLLIDIFLFKNLPLQKKVCLISVVFTIAAICIAANLAYNSMGEYTVSWSSVVCAPFIALISEFMAYTRIQKDHNLLKSVDRIR